MIACATVSAAADVDLPPASTIPSPGLLQTSLPGSAALPVCPIGRYGMGRGSPLDSDLFGFFSFEDPSAQGIAIGAALADSPAGVKALAGERNIDSRAPLYMALPACVTTIAAACPSHSLSGPAQSVRADGVVGHDCAADPEFQLDTID